MSVFPAHSLYVSRRVFFLLFAAVAAPALWADIARTPVRSSNLASVGHDAKRRVLEIEFRHGAVYRYYNVPREVFHGLMRAESKGRWFAAKIRNRFRYERLPGKVTAKR